MHNLDDVICEIRIMKEEIISNKCNQDRFESELQTLKTNNISLKCEIDMLKYEIRKMSNPEEFI